MELNNTNFRIDSAPLQGLTDYHFRNAHAKYYSGISTYYTPFIRMENDGTFRNKDIRDAKQENNSNGKTVPQLLCGDGEEAKLIVEQLLRLGWYHCDLNLGCSFPMIAKRGKGAGLFLHPEKVAEIVEVLERYSGELRYSVKMRLGWDNLSQGEDVVRLLNTSSCEHITLHARYGKDGYKEACNRADFKRLLDEAKVPVVYNGDVTTNEELKAVREAYPQLAGVALGRGLMMHPWIAESQEESIEADAVHMKTFTAFYEELYSNNAEFLQNDIFLLKKMQSYWTYFLPNADRKLRKAILKTSSLKKYNEAVNCILR